jgi:hypothetical protein
LRAFCEKGRRRGRFRSCRVGRYRGRLRRGCGKSPKNSFEDGSACEGRRDQAESYPQLDGDSLGLLILLHENAFEALGTLAGLNRTLRVELGFPERGWSRERCVRSGGSRGRGRR